METCFRDFGPEPGDKYYYYDDDFATFSEGKRKRCKNCHELIDVGDIVLTFFNFKKPLHEIECNIYGADGGIPLANSYLCEKCADLYLSLNESGYCVVPDYVTEGHQEFLLSKS